MTSDMFVLVDLKLVNSPDNKQLLLPKNRISLIMTVILQKHLKKPLEHSYDIRYVCLRRGGVIPRSGDDAI